jgi:hypothetical protein
LIAGLPILAVSTLCGCAAPDTQMADGGPTFIQMPVNSDGLVGATPQILNAAFGKPAILRIDGSAQVWLYHDSGCGLNLVLYPDRAGTPRVAMAAPTDGDASAAGCSAALARDHVAGLGQPPLQMAAPPAVAAPAAAPAAAGDALERPSSS